MYYSRNKISVIMYIRIDLTDFKGLDICYQGQDSE